MYNKSLYISEQHLKIKMSNEFERLKKVVTNEKSVNSIDNNRLSKPRYLLKENNLVEIPTYEGPDSLFHAFLGCVSSEYKSSESGPMKRTQLVSTLKRSLIEYLNVDLNLPIEEQVWFVTRKGQLASTYQSISPKSIISWINKEKPETEPITKNEIIFYLISFLSDTNIVLIYNNHNGVTTSKVFSHDNQKKNTCIITCDDRLNYKTIGYSGNNSVTTLFCQNTVIADFEPLVDSTNEARQIRNRLTSAYQ